MPEACQGVLPVAIGISAHLGSSRLIPAHLGSSRLISACPGVLPVAPTPTEEHAGSAKAGWFGITSVMRSAETPSHSAWAV